MKQIETERLIIREFELSDAEGLFELDSNPDVLKFITYNDGTNNGLL